MKKILVLGSEGFIGSQLIRFGLKSDYEVHGVDLLDHNPAKYHYTKLSLLSPDFDTFLSKYPFDIIFNCAGSGNVPFSVQMPSSDFELNCQSILFILDAVRKHLPKCKYIHVSSAAVYGNSELLPISELAPINPVSPYGYHKWMAEIICREYTTLYGLKIAIVRPFSVYGPGLQKQLLWDVYQKAKSEANVILFGTGDETRDFIYVEDLVRAMFVIARQKCESMEIYNVGSGESITVNDIISKLFDKLEWQKNISFNREVRIGDPRFWQADITKLLSTGFKPSVSLDTGLLQTANWLKMYGI